MLFSKCIKAPAEPGDGVRISIMSRHTLNDGITPDKEIGPNSYDEWWKALAPNEKVLGLYLRGEIPFLSFEENYRYQLYHDEAYMTMTNLINLARTEDVTVLCVERTPEHCHRRILLDVCRLATPDLEVFVA